MVAETNALHVVTLCTGNAARSVMAGVMMTQLAEHEGIPLTITTAGTHVVEGQPMGMRTKQAIIALGELETSMLGRHRSHQLTDRDCERADLIIAMEADHVRYIRRIHPEASARTVTLWRLFSSVGERDEPIRRRLASMRLDAIDLGEERDVADPAGGDQEDYDACAREIWDLCQSVVPSLS